MNTINSISISTLTAPDIISSNREIPSRSGPHRDPSTLTPYLWINTELHAHTMAVENPENPENTENAENTENPENPEEIPMPIKSPRPTPSGPGGGKEVIKFPEKTETVLLRKNSKIGHLQLYSQEKIPIRPRSAGISRPDKPGSGKASREEVGQTWVKYPQADPGTPGCKGTPEP